MLVTGGEAQMREEGFTAEGAEKSKPALLRRARANVPFLKAHRQECLCHYMRKRRAPGRTSVGRPARFAELLSLFFYCGCWLVLG